MSLEIERLKKEVDRHIKNEDYLSTKLDDIGSILHTTNDLYVIKDQNFIYKFVNQAFCDFLGKTESEIIGKDDFELFPLQEAEIYRNDDAYVLFSEQQLIREEEVTGGSGKRYLQVVKNLISYPLSENKCILCSVRDITAIKDAERKLAEISEFNRAIIANSPIGILVYSSNGDCVFSNIAAASIIGATVDQVLKQNFRRIDSWKKSGLLEFAELALFEGICSSQVFNIKTTFDKNIWVSCCFTVFIKNESRHLLLTIEDITKTKEFELRLINNNKFLNTIINSIPFPFYVVDAVNYNIVLANNYTASNDYWRNKTCHEVTHHNNLPCSDKDHGCPLTEVKQSKANVIMEHIHFDKNGAEIVCEVHGYPILDEKGNVSHMIEFSIDISERKKIVAEREALIDQLQAALSEIKTLRGIVPICSYCKKIRNDKGYWNKIEEYVTEHTEAKFSHSICPQCMKKNFPEYPDLYSDLTDDEETP